MLMLRMLNYNQKLLVDVVGLVPHKKEVNHTAKLYNSLRASEPSSLVPEESVVELRNGNATLVL